MMSRKFTLREKILLLVCAVILLGVFYYFVIWAPTSETINNNNSEELQSELLIEQAKAMSITTMKKSIEDAKTNNLGTVAAYNNLSNEINELNSILNGTSSINLTFSDATLSGTTVRRDITVNYSTSNYAQARSVMNDLAACKYRCLIKDATISSKTSTATSGVQSAGTVDVSLKITFFETATGATSMDGLKVEQTTTTAAATAK